MKVLVVVFLILAVGSSIAIEKHNQKNRPVSIARSSVSPDVLDSIHNFWINIQKSYVLFLGCNANIINFNLDKNSIEFG